MIQHGNMMQLLLWHALSTLKDSLKEKAGRFPFPACCWAGPDPEDSDRKAHLTVDDCGICQTHTNMAKYCTVWSVCSIDIYWLHSRSPVVLDLWVIFWAFREMRDTKVPSHSNSRLSHFHHSLPGRAKISDTMWHPHTHKDHKDKKRETHLDHLQDLEISLHVPISLQLVQVLTQSKRTLEHLAIS